MNAHPTHTIWFVACLILCGMGGPRLQAEEVRPLAQAHAHNDYEHDRPLLDALDQGFTSVEADVHLVNGELLVAHDAFRLQPHKTIERLYLDPLQARVTEHKGSVYEEPAEFTLLVDLKTEAEATYAALDAKLAKYPELFTRWTEQGREPGPVTVIVSGNRPIETMAKQPERRAGVDGRLADLERPAEAELMPLISDRWGAHFQWPGTGAMPEEERKALRAIVEKTHARGQKVRFWATADTPEMWRELRTAEVDYINTDDLSGLAKFLRSP
jgi:glycerophosphoryl diester phosphodiesterase